MLCIAPVMVVLGVALVPRTFYTPVRLAYYLSLGWWVLYGGSVPYFQFTDLLRLLVAVGHRGLPVLPVRPFAFPPARVGFYPEGFNVFSLTGCCEPIPLSRSPSQRL